MAEEITGYKFEEVYQEEIDTLFPGFSAWKRSIGGPAVEVLRHLGFSRWETKFRRKEGVQLILGFSFSPLQDSSDREIGSILIFQDLTRLREMEEHLKRADRLAAVGKMAAGIAHEIRNPLASISGSIEMLKDEMENSASNRELMGIILREVGRLNSLIEDFLLFARPDLTGEGADPPERTHRRNPQHVRPQPRFPSPNPVGDPVPGRALCSGRPPPDPAGFLESFYQCRPGDARGGELRVELRKKAAPGFPSRGPAQGEISVSDTGMGIGEEEMGKIFDPFFTTKERGTGLGLSIVHSILESYGGKITVQSQKGEGTVFTVFLPLLESAAERISHSVDPLVISSRPSQAASEVLPRN